MTTKLKRLREFDLTLEIKNDQFIRPPRDSQRNWLLNKAVQEFSHNLWALDKIASGFVPGHDGLPVADRTQAVLTDEQIMEDWQFPIMEQMAEYVCAQHGDVLEVGFGRGVSASMIQERGVRSHTIIECNDSIVGRFECWRSDYPQSDIRMAHGRWQDVLGDLGEFDGVFFHTYPLNEDDFVEQVGSSMTFAEHFFPHAAAHLKPGGCFTYLTNEVDSLSRAHQRALLKYFSSIEMTVVGPLNLPNNVHDAWWSDSMVAVKVTR